MKKNIWKIAFLLALVPLISPAQQSKYFQQHVEYNIDVLLDGVAGYLYGNYELIYTNHSPDTLHQIYMHLYPNAYSGSSSELARQLLPSAAGGNKLYFADESEQGFIDSLNFYSPSQKITVADTDKDVILISLSRPLLPGGSIRIKTPFRVQVPEAGFSRMGRNKENFQITQWFPKPAVYDSHGWHLIPNRNIGEFYGEFGNFRVRIMVPDHYVTGSTGIVVKEEKWRREHLPGFEHSATESMKYKTIHIKADSVHTFAWCSGKDYLRIREELVIDAAGKTVTAYIYYLNDKSKSHWKKQFSTIHDALEFYSSEIGPYPYPQVTVAQNVTNYGGGMEYPMFTLVNKTSGYSQEALITHEIGHNWFYGVLGFNERENPWMDEGLNTLYEVLYMSSKYPQLSLYDVMEVGELELKNLAGTRSISYEEQHYLSYLMLALRKMNRPVTLPSGEYSAVNYFIHTYYMPAQYFLYFRSLVGEKEFGMFMKSFWQKWKFKHPQPEDFYRHLKQHFPEHAQWFINEMLTTDKRADYSIKKVKHKGDSVEVMIKNKASLAAPFKLRVKKQNQDTVDVLVDGFSGRKTVAINVSDVAMIKIDPDEKLPELKRDNNEYHMDKVFPKANKTGLKWIYHVPEPGRKFLFWTPVLGYNCSDNVMPGLLVYNDPVFSMPVHFRMSALYSTGNNTAVGEGRMTYHKYSDSRNFTGWKFSTYLKRYSFYELRDDRLMFNLVTPELAFYFRGAKSSGFEKRFHKTGVKLHMLQEEYLGMKDWELKKQKRNSFVLETWYNFSEKMVYGSREFDLSLEYAYENLKISSEYNYSYIYNAKGKSLDIRLFGGAFLATGSKGPLDMRFRLSSWSGRHDYLYENTMLYRGSAGGAKVFDYHMTVNDGGFKSLGAVGQSWEYLYSANLHFDLPFSIPIGIFGSLGSFGHPDKLALNYPRLFYEGGLSISIWEEHVRAYFTLLKSKELKDSSLFSFTLNFDMLNPFNLVNMLDPTYE